MTTYYNEIEPFAAAWLRNLISAGHIAGGAGSIVNENSIADITALDLVEHDQFHTFAGIGVWSAALRAAGWPDTAEAWSGSCPCQPFSAAGSRKGFDDDRHLWPTWFKLIRECSPPVVFGEQVASKDGLEWLDLVQTDLEGVGYAFAAFDLCAAGIGAPHIRQRIYFVAIKRGPRLDRVVSELRARLADDDERGRARLASARLHDQGQPGHDADRCGADGRGRLADSAGAGISAEAVADTRASRLGNTKNARADHCDEGAREGERPHAGRLEPERGGIADRDHSDAVGNADGVSVRGDAGTSGRSEVESGDGPDADDAYASSPTSGYWADCEWVPCRELDGEIVFRPIEPGTFPLADGAVARVGRLRAYGNAIVRPLAQAFVETVMGVLCDEGI